MEHNQLVQVRLFAVSLGGISSEGGSIPYLPLSLQSSPKTIKRLGGCSQANCLCLPRAKERSDALKPVPNDDFPRDRKRLREKMLHRLTKANMRKTATCVDRQHGRRMLPSTIRNGVLMTKRYRTYRSSCFIRTRILHSKGRWIMTGRTVLKLKERPNRRL